MIKLDLHTHSIGSSDGGIRLDEYKALLANNTLDYIAITDHDTIDEAKKIRAELGDKIIIGQEITSSQGELIGLFLSKKVDPGQSLEDTAKAIKDQNGLVYVPHPFETVRKGIDAQNIEKIQNYIDIVEVHNGRAVFQNKGPKASVWARLHNKATAASSDAHGRHGIGTTYTTVSQVPTKDNLVNLLVTSHKTITRPPLLSLLYPKYNRLRAKLNRK